MSIFKPNFTQIPNVFLDNIMSELTEKELKVLLYIMRRTYGFSKGEDRISLTQFSDGIITRSGQIVDTGCGVSRSNVVLAIDMLLEKKLITKKESKEGNLYGVNLNYTLTKRKQVVSNQDQQDEVGSPKSGLEVVLNQDSQYKVQNKELLRNTPKENSTDSNEPVLPSQGSVNNDSLNQKIDLMKETDWLMKSSQMVHRIAGFYLRYKRFDFRNREQLKQQVSFSIKEAKKLVGYTAPEIEALFNYADQNFKDWTIAAIANNAPRYLQMMVK